MHVLMMVKSGVTDDARIRREASALAAAGHRVTVIGDRPGPDLPIPGVEVRFSRPAVARASWAAGSRLRRVLRWALLPNHRRRDDRAFAAAASELAGQVAADVVHAHDLSGLDAAMATSGRPGRLVYDAHECWTGRRQAGRPDPLGRWLDGRRERRHGARADIVVTVSEELAQWLRRHRRFPDVRVIRNTAALGTGRPAAPTAAHYGGRIDDERDLVAAAEGAARVEGIELMVRGGGDAAAIADLRRVGIEVLDAIAPDLLLDELQQAGIGLVTLSGGSINHDVALPNKLFLAVQAGVPVVAADLPAMRRVVEAHGIGTLYTPGDAASFAEALATVVRDHADYCDAAAAARPALSWEHDAAVLVALYAEVFGS